MDNYLICIFPITAIIILCFKMKIAKRGAFIEECWSLTDSKSLQVIAAYFVILHHLSQLISRYGEVYSGPVTVLANMGILFTAIFFFYSGYGLMRSLMTKEKYLDGFLIKRLMVILVPFFLTNIIYLFPGISKRRITSLYGFFTSVFGITLMNTNAWFVVELIIFYLVFYFAYKYIKDDKKAFRTVVGSVFIVIVIGLLLPHDYTDINGHWFRGEWWYNSTILFAIGLTVGKYREIIIEFAKKYYKALIMGITVLLALAATLEVYVRINYGYYFETYTTMGYPQKVVTLLAQIFLCTVFIVFILAITMKVRFDNKLLRTASAITFELYLIHDFCMMNYSYEDKVPHITIFTSVLVVATIAAILLHILDVKLIGIATDFLGNNLAKSDSYEGTVKSRKLNRIIKGVITAYALCFVGLIITFCIEVYNNTVVAKAEFEKHLETIHTSKVGDIVKYGRFDMDYLVDGLEDLEWIVVKVDGSKRLLLCKDALFGMSYYAKYKRVDYYHSDVRKMMVTIAYFELLSKRERERVVVDETTKDKMFLLSPQDIEEIELTSEELAALPAKSAEYMGLNKDGQDNHSWCWLRSEEFDVVAPILSSEGEVGKVQEVSRPSGGFRPCIWVE